MRLLLALAIVVSASLAKAGTFSVTNLGTTVTGSVSATSVIPDEDVLSVSLKANSNLRTAQVSGTAQYEVTYVADANEVPASTAWVEFDFSGQVSRTDSTGSASLLALAGVNPIYTIDADLEVDQKTGYKYIGTQRTQVALALGSDGKYRGQVNVPLNPLSTSIGSTSNGEAIALQQVAIAFVGFQAPAEPVSREAQSPDITILKPQNTWNPVSYDPVNPGGIVGPSAFTVKQDGYTGTFQVLLQLAESGGRGENTSIRGFVSSSVVLKWDMVVKSTSNPTLGYYYVKGSNAEAVSASITYGGGGASPQATATANAISVHAERGGQLSDSKKAQLNWGYVYNGTPLTRRGPGGVLYDGVVSRTLSSGENLLSASAGRLATAASSTKTKRYIVLRTP